MKKNQPSKETSFKEAQEYGNKVMKKAVDNFNRVFPNALDIQVGGAHYKIPIQPVEYIFKNNLNYLQGNIIKYATRYKDKNGKEDLEKVKHYADLLIELEYGDE